VPFNLPLQEPGRQSQRGKSGSAVDFQVRIRQKIAQKSEVEPQPVEYPALAEEARPDTEFQKELVYLQHNSIMDYNEGNGALKEVERLGLGGPYQPERVVRTTTGPTIARALDPPQPARKSMAAQYEDFLRSRGLSTPAQGQQAQPDVPPGKQGRDRAPEVTQNPAGQESRPVGRPGGIIDYS